VNIALGNRKMNELLWSILCCSS